MFYFDQELEMRININLEAHYFTNVNVKKIVLFFVPISSSYRWNA
jgi:hypothetical protein